MADQRAVAVWQALRHRPARYLVSGWPWRCWAYLLSGTVLGYGALIALVLLVLAGIALSAVGVGLVILAATPLFGSAVGALERRRLRLIEPVRSAGPHGSVTGRGPVSWVGNRLRERATWRELGYTVLFGTVFTLAGAGVLAVVSVSALLTASPVIAWALAPETVMIIPGQPVTGPLDALPGPAAGIPGLVLGAYAAGLLAGLQVRTAEFLLAPRDDEPSRRVIELTRSRARLADAFEAERRRIERDLHDGAQQQLVALNMTLGMAEMELRAAGSPTTELVSRARGEVRATLTRLRDLVRGIHPQVLTDHGLADAVAEVALRHPVPVTVDIALPHRLPEAVETVAYFTVTEALANAAKHSDATAVTVVGRLRHGALRLLITDNGNGGADPAAGTGLQGLADRMAILGGSLVVSSPVGGPTQLRAEVPCSA
ncbi:sensor histidine kinase [Streptomyces chattanoogensis]|uniref:sensor histidine kinase n=1 Tax=Streptomyces chattanoogensis TaxID=66876 RepID=UPI00367D2AD8